MRSVHLIVTLGATLVSGVPIQPRDFDFGGGGSLFADSGNSLDGDFTSSVGGAGGLGLEGFDVASNSFGDDLPAGGDLGFTGESFTAEGIDLSPAIDMSAVPQENLYVDTPQIVADIVPTDPGLGAVSGDLLAVAPTTPDTNQLTTGNSISFDSNTPIAEFTPTDAGLAVIAAGENLNPADIGVYDPSDGSISGEPTDPGPGPSSGNDGGLSIAGFVAPPDLGSDTALTPNLEVINTPIAFSPEDNNVAAQLDLTTPSTQVASTEGTLGTTEKAPTLGDFKNAVAKIQADPNVPADEKKFWRETAAPLTESDFGKITLKEEFSTPVKAADGSTVPGQKVSDLSPQTQQQYPRVNVPSAYRTNNGFNLNGIAQSLLGTVGQAAIRLGSLVVEKNALRNGGTQIYTVVQRVGVPVSVPVPVTQRVGVAVPVTVYSTLPGGVVTRILIYRPKTVTATTTRTSPQSTKTPIATPTIKPNANIAKGAPAKGAPAKAGAAKRHIEEPSAPDAATEEQAVDSVPEYIGARPAEEVAYVYGEESPLAQKELPAISDAAEHANWSGNDPAFQYQPGDYSSLDEANIYPHPPLGSSEDGSYPKRHDVWAEAAESIPEK